MRLTLRWFQFRVPPPSRNLLSRIGQRSLGKTYWVEGDPLRLRFRLGSLNPSRDDSQATLDVPVPRGHEAEAHQVYARAPAP
jgi:hypothetical protein